MFLQICVQTLEIAMPTVMKKNQLGHFPHTLPVMKREQMQSFMRIGFLLVIKGIVETGNNVHTRAVRLQLILFSKTFGAFLIQSIGGFSPLYYTDK
jgi:hypothetical protein